MRVLSTAETRSSRLTFFLVGLAIAVFAWGLQYKLSLYDPPQAISHRIPEAKLLSRNEETHETKRPVLDVSRGPAERTQRVLSRIFLLISLALNLLRSRISIERKRDAQLSKNSGRHACLDAFFFRPPPVLA
jgi:hypothetical protein